MGMFGGRYNTPLPPDDERKFEAWSQANNRVNDTEDYDLRGAWKADAQAAANGHLPDTWKKPNHPTFSRESMYSTPEEPGGAWVQGDKDWTFWASPANLQYQSVPDIMRYFQQSEPNSTLILPFDYRLPPK